jgi:prolyl-tRNA editing enzyme YbaK/EbsC (Cys-tRNA(Pro) deacylase)
VHDEAPTAVHVRLLAWLAEHGVAARSVEHPPTTTSEASAAARGEPLAVGGKALLLRVGAGDDFQLFVFSAARRLDNAAVRRALGVRHLRFATADELRERTGLVPGSVPPFGPPVLPFPLNLDPSVLQQDRVAFNAGMLTRSLVLAIADYQRIAAPARAAPPPPARRTAPHPPAPPSTTASSRSSPTDRRSALPHPCAASPLLPRSPTTARAR